VKSTRKIGKGGIIAGNMRPSIYILLALLVLLAWRQWENRPLVHPPGVLVAEIPQQNTTDLPAAFGLHGHQVQPVARFSIRARVLSREDYRFDRGAELSPVDLALGWGPMSDQAVLDRIDIRQGGRWYFTRYELPAPISDQEIIRHSANMHLVPANEYVKSRVRKVREGDLIWLRGYLVNISGDDGYQWVSSQRRDDTGDGSCELIYVEQFSIESAGR